MSLVISSTTDTQEQVNAAAGIEAPPAEPTEQEQQPVEEPQPAKPPGEPDEQEDEGDEEEEQKPEQPPQQPKRKSGWLRKIERLERENGYLQRLIEEQNALAGTRKPAVEQPKPLEPPGQENFASYEDFMEAKLDYKLAQRDAEYEKKAREWQAQERQRQVAESWQARVGSFKQTAADFDDVLASADHIQLHPALQQTLMQSDKGPELAYALAKDPERLEFIASLHPEIGRYELARLQRELKTQPPQQQKPTPQISKAPEPITPVARGSNGNGPRTLDDAHDYQEFKRMREAQIAARRKAARKAA